MEYKVKVCKECGVSFTVASERGRTTDYCSPEHKKTAQRRQVRNGVRRFREREAAKKNGYTLPA